MTVAVFGGSFNPPHLAHVLSSVVVRSIYDADRVLVVPTFKHPFSKSLADYTHRVTMCELAMQGLAGVEVSRIEEELGGDSLTLRTLEALRERLDDEPMRLVVGADILVEASKWHRFDRIRELAPPIVLGRFGYDTSEAPAPLVPDISSTRVRDAFAERNLHALETMIPRAVLRYALDHKLYGHP